MEFGDIVGLVCFVILLVLIFLHPKRQKLLSPTPNNSEIIPGQASHLASPSPPDAKVRNNVGFSDGSRATGCLWIGLLIFGGWMALNYSYGIIAGYQLNLFTVILAVLPWAGLAVAVRRLAIGGLLLILTGPLLQLGDDLRLLSETNNTAATVGMWAVMFLIPVSLTLFLIEWVRRKNRRNEIESQSDKSLSEGNSDNKDGDDNNANKNE